MKLLIGGSPCTHWSIAQTKNRETEASGIGWELFLNYRIARDKYQPDYFLYENNKSMSSAIRAQITAELGVEPVLINSALVSAQNRQRLYWAGKRNPDGTYSQVPVELPEDRGILLRDILETKGALVVNALESWKSRTVDAHMGKLENNLVPRMNDPNPAKQQYDCIAEPLHVCAIDGEDAVSVDQRHRGEERLPAGDVQPIQPCRSVRESTYPFDREHGHEQLRRAGSRWCGDKGRRSSHAGERGDEAGVHSHSAGRVCGPCHAAEQDAAGPGHEGQDKLPDDLVRFLRILRDPGRADLSGARRNDHGQRARVPYQAEGRLLHHPQADGPRVYAPPNGPVSDTQAYKMLGNGWTVDVIAHIMGHFKGLAAGPVEVLSMYDGMSCGHIAPDKLGVEIASYHATEIDKFAVQTTQANFPDVVQLGDAFQVREDGWTYAGLTGGTSEAAE